MKAVMIMKAVTFSAATAVLMLGVPGMAHDLGETPQQTAARHQSDLMEKAGLAAMKSGDLVTAEADLRGAVAAGSWNSTAYCELAELFVAQGQTAKAIQVYRKLFYGTQAETGMSPDTVTASLNLTRNDFGTEAFPAWMNYSILLSQAGEWHEAVSVYEQALPLAPGGQLPKINVHFSADSPEPVALQAAAHVARGLHYSVQGSQNRAIGEFSGALQLEPNWAVTNYYYGYGWQRLSPDERSRYGTEQQARAALLKAVKVGKGDVKKAAQKALMVAMNPSGNAK